MKNLTKLLMGVTFAAMVGLNVKAINESWKGNYGKAWTYYSTSWAPAFGMVYLNSRRIKENKINYNKK